MIGPLKNGTERAWGHTTLNKIDEALGLELGTLYRIFEDDQARPSAADPVAEIAAQMRLLETKESPSCRSGRGRRRRSPCSPSSTRPTATGSLTGRASSPVADDHLRHPPAVLGAVGRALEQVEAAVGGDDRP